MLHEHSINQFAAFDIWCGVPIVGNNLLKCLVQYGFTHEPGSSLKLVIDLNNGFALRALSGADTSGLHLVVFTYSRCPEYWADLWDLGPSILIVDAHDEHSFADAIHRAIKGERYKLVPETKTALKPGERTVVSCIARGLSNMQIARELNLQEKTVTNLLTTIYKKLGLKNRTEIAMYYWSVEMNA